MKLGIIDSLAVFEFTPVPFHAWPVADDVAGACEQGWAMRAAGW